MSRPLWFLNLAHAYDHFFLLIFPTAVLALAPAWQMSYGEALAFGTAAFVTFGAGTLPAGWLGDRWSRGHLMSIFFVGLGLAAILTGLAQGPLGLTLGLGLIALVMVAIAENARVPVDNPATHLELTMVHEAMVLGASILGVIAITVAQERKAERALDALRDLSSPRALVVRDGERRRIAGELHDRVGQNLSALNINLDIVLGALGGLVPDGADLSSLTAKAGLLAQAIIVTLAGGAAYAAVSWVLGVRELRTIVAILADLIRRRGRS